MRCVALLSGGLDSMLAIRIMQEQNIEVESVNFKTAFTCCQDTAGKAARDLGTRLTVIGQDDDYFDLIRRPQFGYGKGANPCIDCRIYMFEKAKVFMEQCGASFMISGEVIGQRPKSQKKRDLRAIAYHADLDDLLLRPLSAKQLPPTLPEREGWVDREKLYGFVGRGRKELIALAKEFGFQDIPSPSTGCALTEPRFSQKVFDLVRKGPESSRWDFDLLKIGRHFRIDDSTKVIVGRSEEDNDALAYMHQLPTASRATLLSPDGFPGPRAMVVGHQSAENVDIGISLVMRYCREPSSESGWIKVQDGENVESRPAVATRDVNDLLTIATK